MKKVEKKDKNGRKGEKKQQNRIYKKQENNKKGNLKKQGMEKVHISLYLQVPTSIHYIYNKVILFYIYLHTYIYIYIYIYIYKDKKLH